MVSSSLAGNGARIATATLLILGSALVVGLNWPGHLSYDSVIQLLDGRTGRYHTWHPPFMAWLLGLGDHLIRGPGLFITLQTSLLFAALAIVVLKRPVIGRFSPAVVVILLALPQVLLWQAIVWKDVLFADCVVAGFTLLWLALGNSGRRRVLWTAGGFVLLMAAALVRQNGIIALILGGAALGFGMGREAVGAFSSRLLRAVAPAAIVLLTGFAAVLAVTWALDQHAVDEGGPEAQIHMLQTYDVVGAVAHDPRIQLTQLSPSLGGLIRSTANTRYTSERNDDLLGNPFDKTTAAAADDIEGQWIDIIVHHPLPWLRHRLAVFGWLVASPQTVCFAETTGVDGPAPQLKALGITPGQTPRDLALERYAGAFHGTPIYSHFFYGALAIALMIVMFRSKINADAVFGFMLAAALLFVLSFLAIGVACDYRYLYALDLTTIVVAFYWALGLGTGERRWTLSRT